MQSLKPTSYPLHNETINDVKRTDTWPVHRGITLIKDTLNLLDEVQIKAFYKATLFVF